VHCNTCNYPQKYENHEIISNNQNKPLPPSSSTKIKLNVGGTYYTTSISTLTKEPDSMLGKMFSGAYAIIKEDDGSVFIDRDGESFKYVLEYLRDGDFYVPDDEVDLYRLKKEINYFGLDGMSQILEMEMEEEIKFVFDKKLCPFIEDELNFKGDNTWRTAVLTPMIDCSTKVTSVSFKIMNESKPTWIGIVNKNVTQFNTINAVVYSFGFGGCSSIDKMFTMEGTGRYNSTRDTGMNFQTGDIVTLNVDVREKKLRIEKRVDGTSFTLFCPIMSNKVRIACSLIHNFGWVQIVD